MKFFKFAALAALLSLAFTTQALAEKIPTPNEPPEGVQLATPQDLMDVFHAGGDVYDVRWHYSEYEFEGHIPFAKCVPFSE